MKRPLEILQTATDMQQMRFHSSIQAQPSVAHLRVQGSEVSLPRNLNCFKVRLVSTSPLFPRKKKKEHPGANLALPRFQAFKLIPSKGGTGPFQATNPPYSAPRSAVGGGRGGETFPPLKF